MYGYSTARRSKVAKGIQKRIIIIRTEKGSSFESAFFILRKDSSRETNEDSMLLEAQRIIAESERYKGKRKQGKQARAFAIGMITLILGIIVGSATVGILWIILG